MNVLHLSFASLALAATAGAQSLNIDVGAGSGVPTSAYGAAAGVPGEWNQIDGIGPATYGGLVDIGGAATGVMVDYSAGADFMFDNPSTLGEDQALYDDLSDVHANGGPPMDLTISGLNGGVYDVYTYAWAPDNATFLTMVDVTTPALANPQTVGGAWPGTHALGVTYALHSSVAVPAGTDLVINFAQVPASATPGSLNGLQIIDLSSNPLGMPDPLCTPLPNSTGFPASIQLSGNGLAGSKVEGTCGGGPVGGFGYFISGPNSGLYLVPPGSMGIICIGNPQFRYNSVPLGQVFQFDAQGVSQAVSGGGPASLPTDGSFAPVPGVMSGGTRFFQAWYRDGASSNFSDSLGVTFN